MNDTHPQLLEHPRVRHDADLRRLARDHGIDLSGCTVSSPTFGTDAEMLQALRTLAAIPEPRR